MDPIIYKLLGVETFYADLFAYWKELRNVIHVLSF